MGISMNGPSGIDTAYIIDSLVALENNRVLEVESKISSYQVKIDAYSKLRSLLDDIGKKSGSLEEETDFNIFKTTSSDEDLVTFRTGLGAVEGAYNVGVYQLAQAEKMISASNFITSQSAALSTYGITPGDINIDGVSIAIDADDTIQDLRMKINNAVDADGNKLGVTATVLKLSDTNFRLLLTAKDQGAAGVAYKDTTGNVLQRLGIILDKDGAKGNTFQTLTSAADVQTAFASLAVGQSIEYAGKDRDGNAVQGTFVYDAGLTIDDFLAQVEQTFRGMADASIDGSGKLVITDKVAGSSQLSVSSFSIAGVASGVSISQAGKEGAGVLNTGKDAFYSIDGLLMQADSNTPTGVISGVTMELHAVSIEKTASLEMGRDFDGIVDKIQELFSSFNAIVRFSKEETSYGKTGEDAEKTTKGDLAGDLTVRNIVSKFRTLFQQRFSVLGGDFSNVAMIGIKTNAQTGEITVDEDVLKGALEKDYDSVIGMFVTKGFSSNANVTMGRYSKDTVSGKYALEEPDAGHLRMRADGGTEWFMSDPRMGDVVSFKNGLVSGLALTAPAGTVGAGGATFTFSRGLSEQISDLVDETNDNKEGLIFMRQETWRLSIDRAEDRIVQLEDRIEKFRLRLVNQFSSMEQTLNDMKSQSSNMLSSLGFYS